MNARVYMVSDSRISRIWGHPEFLHAVAAMATIAREGFFANRWDLAEHHGTHLDAPATLDPKG